jgi:hypothetical protein
LPFACIGSKAQSSTVLGTKVGLSHQGMYIPLIPEARAFYGNIIKSTFLAEKYTVSKLTVFLTQIE